MKITVLVENTSRRDDIVARHGLSLYIEARGRRILFDMGQDELFYENAKRHFSHNIHSVRVLDGIFPLNITLQTLNGIASHDGEMELSEYYDASVFLDIGKELQKKTHRKA